MITKSEIDIKAKEFEIHPTNVERDYVFGWIIFGLFTISELKDYIFLKGGNALRKGYLEHTRFSSDLDFGIPNGIDKTTLTTELNKVCDFIEEKAGIHFVKENIKIEERFKASEIPIPGLQVWEVRIYFKDFYGKPGKLTLKISMDITEFDLVLLPIQTVKLIHPYSDANDVSCEIRCMKLEEIIATKLKCLLQRQHAPDLFDYVYSMKILGSTLNRDELVDAFVRKTIFGRNPHTLKDILCKTPFDYFKRTWINTIICAKQLIFAVEDAINIFISDLENLFSVYPNTNYYGSFAYFSAELRVHIMEAGRNQTRLKVRYNGVERIVEPYSLKYLQRKNGGQREYLYVYNCSGGNNPPGVRCFVHENIQSIENTEEKFEPRYQIELSKAGETPENPYLFDPNKPLRAPRFKASVFGNKRITKYIYKCGYCGKEFSRTQRSSALNAHKNKQKRPCSGRMGIYVTTKY